MTSAVDYTRGQRDAQKTGSQEQAQATGIDAAVKRLHTMLPGIIVSFDPVKQTAQVQPAIKRIFASFGPINLPLCVDVPVSFPGGGDYFMTFPVQPGDECILMFSERAIDNWYIAGDVQEPSEYRTHDLSDGIAIVGLNSQPKSLASFNMEQVEIRSRTGTAFIRMNQDSVEIIAPGGVTIDADVTVTGDVIASGVSLVHHTHSGVEAGPDNTGQPN